MRILRSEDQKCEELAREASEGDATGLSYFWRESRVCRSDPVGYLLHPIFRDHRVLISSGAISTPTTGRIRIHCSLLHPWCIPDLKNSSFSVRLSSKQKKISMTPMRGDTIWANLKVKTWKTADHIAKRSWRQESKAMTRRSGNDRDLIQTTLVMFRAAGSVTIYSSIWRIMWVKLTLQLATKWFVEKLWFIIPLTGFNGPLGLNFTQCPSVVHQYCWIAFSIWMCFLLCRADI